MEQVPQDGQAAALSLEPIMPEELCMEELIDKLRLLNYEKDFCRRKRPHKRLLPPAYFAQAGNQAEQFMYFSSLAAWLLQQCGLDVPNPKDHEDPHGICATLMAAARRLGFAPPSYAPTKLTGGWGREVCALLWALADAVIARRRVSPARPVYRQDSERGEAEGDGADQGSEDDSELLHGDGYREGLAGGGEEEVLEVVQGGRGQAGQGAAAGADSSAAAPERQILESKVDPTLWRLEQERLAPQLRITVAADARDWRGHLEQARTAGQAVDSGWGDARPLLERLCADVSSSLDKLDTRQGYLNTQLHTLLMQYQAARQQASVAQEEQERHAELVSERNDELSRLVARLEEAQAVLEERGSSMSDASPLVRIKAAIKAVKEELRGMDVRSGVVAHSLMQRGLRDRQARVAQGMMAVQAEA